VLITTCIWLTVCRGTAVFQEAEIKQAAKAGNKQVLWQHVLLVYWAVELVIVTDGLHTYWSNNNAVDWLVYASA